MPDRAPYCFISYSREDSAIAEWLLDKLESFKYPANRVKLEVRPDDPVYLRPIFLDTSDLPTTHSNAWDDLFSVIDRSRYLLVLCSRNSAKSPNVDREIRRFIGTNESRLEDIILVICDPAVKVKAPTLEDFPLSIWERWGRLAERNHMQIRPARTAAEREVRTRCFFQIVGYMLDIPWTDMYNRHLIQQRKRAWRNALVIAAVLGSLVALLLVALYNQHQRLEKEQELVRTERELVEFEKKIFPGSIVFGYVDNFLSPVITKLDSAGAKKFRIIVALPDAYDDLDQPKRVQRYKDFAAQAGYGSELRKVATKLPRGAEIAQVVPTPPEFKERNMDVYIDFASTVVAFKKVIDFKQAGNATYARMPQDTLVAEYGREFERAVLAQLRADTAHGDQSGFVVFVRSPQAALRILEEGP